MSPNYSHNEPSALRTRTRGRAGGGASGAGVSVSCISHVFSP